MPYEKAFKEGRSMTSEFMVRERKDDLGEIVQASRMGTADDFDLIVRETNTEKAARLAHDLFGEYQAGEIMSARRDVKKLSSATEEARDKYKKEGGEIFKKRQEEFSKTRD